MNAFKYLKISLFCMSLIVVQAISASFSETVSVSRENFRSGSGEMFMGAEYDVNSLSLEKLTVDVKRLADGAMIVSIKVGNELLYLSRIGSVDFKIN